MVARAAVKTKAKVAAFKMVIDLGNAAVKAICGGVEIQFPHALAEVPKSVWDEAQTRSLKDSAYDFVGLDGRWYIVGGMAAAHEVMKRAGRTKYVRDYYGPFFASAVARLFAADPLLLKDGVAVVASHATRDSQFAGDIVASIKGQWSFDCSGRHYSFRVSGVDTFEESFGGYNNIAFARKGSKWEMPLYGSETGILDIGGGTIAATLVNGKGVIVAADNGIIGINNALATFDTELQHDLPDVFQLVRQIPESMLREGLRTGKINNRGKPLDVSAQAHRALTPIMNEARNLYIKVLNDGLGLDTLGLTGGGSGILESRITEAFQFGNVCLADESETIQFANARGAAKLQEVMDGYV